MCAAYYASDGSSWLQEGDDLNQIDVFSDPYRIVCTTSEGDKLFDCELFSDCVYQKPSEQFHQWASQTGEAYGLSFPTTDEAADLAHCVESIIASLQYEEEHHLSPHSVQQPQEHTLNMATGALPPPHKFPITRRELLSSDAGWRLSETALRLTYPARLRAALQVSAVTELAREAHVQEFEDRYRDFTVSNLWLAVNDVTSERVGREGLQALGANMLSLGIPLGVYLLDEQRLSQSSACQMVLCKVILARSLPIAEENLASLREAADLPVGYQSYTITPSKNVQSTEGVPTNQFEHLYLVPHPHLVLMTHSIKFGVGAPTDVQDSVPLLASSPAMSLLATHPEVLSAEDRESIFAVCSPGQLSPGRASRDLSHAVDLSYQSMWDELNSLAKTQQELEANLSEFCGSVGTFQSNSWKCVQCLQDDMVSYLGHSGQVLQLFRDRKFEMNRALSDISRFQELFLFTQKTCTPQELLCSWRHLNVLWDQLAQEIEFLTMQPPTNQSLMALTERNKKMISLKRGISFKDKMIARISEKLDERGILDSEDLQLVGTL